MQGRKPVIKPIGGNDTVVDLPLSEVRIPKPPASLTDPMARESWDEIARIMVARNTYDDDCAHMLEAFCVQRARFLFCDAKVQELGQMYKSSKKGTIVYNPWLTASNAAYTHMVKLASELGLTPVSRQRIVKVHRKVASSPASKFLKSG